ncbi:hypothetical protein NKR23_g8334 [Pleurostoma richardsiae]|uniref:Uncharacterized protein n=1 Tax=Pleurostoma richardsiae TaxID=41990 RepID=A0AA38R981_9PEZI|nr:hypothetical protein NKR23_g8334 [Pleurostoma richardsiae]
MPNPLAMNPINQGGPPPGAAGYDFSGVPNSGQGQGSNAVENSQFTFQNPSGHTPHWPFNPPVQETQQDTLDLNTPAGDENAFARNRKRSLGHDGSDNAPTSKQRRFSDIRSFTRRHSGAFQLPRPSTSSSTALKDITNVSKQFLGRVTPSNLLKRVNSMSSRSSRASSAQSFRLQFAFIGDQEAGKSSLIRQAISKEDHSSSINLVFEQSYTPTEFDMQTTKINNENYTANVELWDIPAHADNPHPLHLAWFDACIICFNVRDEKNLDSLIKWNNLCRVYCDGTPIFLVGLKKDTRPFAPSLRLRLLNEPVAVSLERGHAAAKEIGAVQYLECSSKTGEGVNTAFETILELTSHRKALTWRRCEERSVGKRVSDMLCLSRK